ncbi:MAG: dihydropteroate synthase, partial [Chloroflexi bacterium]|nr:dihydropteroate synthase [Chloroflexota bacterium]
CKFLRKRCEAAKCAGVESESIVNDPGLGFGKSVEQCYELIKRMDKIQTLGFPVLCAVSRKSFIGAVTGKSVPADRVIGSAAVSVMHYQAGVRLFRVHDVAANCEALAVASAVYGPVKTD